MMNRRDFVAMLAAASATLKTSPSLAEALVAPQEAAAHTSAGRGISGGGFPSGDYTPFGYLDNPWHTWDLHRSGIFRSLPGIGFGLYYPAGPGGYFDYKDNGIYSAELALGFRIGERTLRGAEDFRPGQLTAPHHSKNILAYAFEEGGVHVTCSFVQVDENALAVRVEFAETAGRAQSVTAAAFHTYRLGGRDWWGRDGLAGNFDEESRALWIRGFAAGTAFAIAGDRASGAHFFSGKDEDCDTWLGTEPKSGEKLAYYPQPLHGALRYEIDLAPHGRAELVVVMARSTNTPGALKHARASLPRVAGALTSKRAEDAALECGSAIDRRLAGALEARLGLRF